MVTYDIELGQGDIDNVEVILKLNNVGVDLTGYNIVFNMKNTNNLSYSISCLAGAVTPINKGGVRIPFTDEHTSVPGIFTGQFVVVSHDLKNTFPLGGYMTVRIWEAI